MHGCHSFMCGFNTFILHCSFNIEDKTITITSCCTAGDSLDVCDEPKSGPILLSLLIPDPDAPAAPESRCKTVHSPPAASPSFWTDSRDEGPNRVGKDAEVLRPFGGSTSSEEEEDISQGGKQGTPTISVTKTII